mgnify:CR=1 FL=1
MLKAMYLLSLVAVLCSPPSGNASRNEVSFRVTVTEMGQNLSFSSCIIHKEIDGAFPSISIFSQFPNFFPLQVTLPPAEKSSDNFVVQSWLDLF